MKQIVLLCISIFIFAKMSAIQLFEERSYLSNDRCNVRLANENICFLFAEELSVVKSLSVRRTVIDELSFYGIHVCSYSANSLLDTLFSDIDKKKYQDFELVSNFTRYPDFMNAVNNQLYFCDYIPKKEYEKKIELCSSKVDSFECLVKEPLFEFMKSLAADSLKLRFPHNFDECMKNSSKQTFQIFQWINNKSNGCIKYLSAKYCPFTVESGLGIHIDSDTLFIYGNQMTSKNCFLKEFDRSIESPYYIFYAIAQGHIRCAIPDEDYNEILICAISDAWYIEYLKEKADKKNKRDSEINAVFCLYHKHEQKIGNFTFDEFYECFHSLYKKKADYVKIEDICKIIMTDYPFTN